MDRKVRAFLLFMKIRAGVTYSYDPNHAHAVSSLSNGNSYGYDANGSMTTRTVNGEAFNLGYDAENRLISVTGPNLTASFVYDADGRQVKAIINGETTLYIGQHYEAVVNGAVTITKYYFAGVNASRCARTVS
jgi:YD repeat-containing protein